MRLELHDVAIGDGPGAALPRLGAVADRWVPGFVAVETENAPTLASLVAGGRMRPETGRVTIDGRADDAAIRASFALVDTPTVAEPFAALTVVQVAREELALAGLRADKAAARLLLAEIGLGEHERTRLSALPTELRVRLLCELAVLRPEVRGLIVTTPERHGGDVAAWLSVVHDLVGRDYTVLTITGFAALATIESLPTPEFAAAGTDAVPETDTAPPSSPDDTAVAATPDTSVESDQP
ncbi:hypothetical protein IFT79_13885 [Frigoribacterium sp. CFBP 8759]|uniref:hypothetical protein n=1 Tax=Frigoribacterium sp. CFBP 8759 TaxID=2775283 RepID=UPI00177ECD7B|nr:hypothetical protein [Frigoribacterium sp. CFBP 8759]MBD8486708.1 hypothetical protein [Frigoribacterium sp. CFBP 8759]